MRTIPLLLLLAGTYHASAQKITQEKGLTTAIFNYTQGNIKVHLPNDIRPGDKISGTIVNEPVGNSPTLIRKNASALNRMTVRVNNINYTPSDKNPVSIQFTIGTSVDIQVNPANKATAQSIQVQPANNISNDANECVPAHALKGDPLPIKGSFDGNASNTSCLLGGRPLQVLAESYRQCIVRYPAEATGIQTLTVQENGKQLCSRPISSVQLDVTAGKLNLQKGEQTYIDVNITGLQNLPDTAVLTLTNTSTGIIILQPTNLVVIPLPPDAVAAGSFYRRFDIQSTMTGNFTVNVDLDLPGMQPVIRWEPDPPPIQFDQKKLPKPRRLETKALQIGLHMAIKKLVADAGGARGQEWNTVCDNCRQCIEARMGTWAADLVKELGVGIIKEFAGKAVDLIGKSIKAVGSAKEFFDKVSGNLDNAEKLANDIEAKIRAGELQVLEMAPEICKKSTYCLISATIFYNPTTGCLVAYIYCQGTALCCPEAETIVTISYCTDEKGMPVGLPDVAVVKNK